MIGARVHTGRNGCHLCQFWRRDHETGVLSLAAPSDAAKTSAPNTMPTAVERLDITARGFS
jgi:hypothetical protein